MKVGPNRRRRQLGPSGLLIAQEFYLKQQVGKIGEKTVLLNTLTTCVDRSSPKSKKFST